jgi:hypothetical protein
MKGMQGVIPLYLDCMIPEGNTASAANLLFNWLF